MFSPKSILVPSDFSEYSDRSMRVAIDIAKRFQSKIYLLHVVGIVIQYMPYYGFDPKMVNQLGDKSVTVAQEMLKEQMSKFPDSKSVEVITEVRIGSPYQEILRIQEEKKADLIVIASQGKTGLLKNLIGSVAERVVRNSNCQVLLVK